MGGTDYPEYPNYPPSEPPPVPTQKFHSQPQQPVVPTPHAAPPGWYPDPAGGDRMRRWDGRQWGGYKNQLGGIAITFLIITGFFMMCAGGCGFAAFMGSRSDETPSSSAVTTMRPLSSTTPAIAAANQCYDAPQSLVDQVNAGFTNAGEFLEHAQAVDGPDGVVFIGGNIFDADGKVASQETWAVVGGVVYGMTRDARQRTIYPDGRDMAQISYTWTEYNDVVGPCVGRVERGG